MRARRIFYEGLSSMLAAGIPVRSAMDQIAGGGRGAFGESLHHLSGAVHAGRSLSDAMAEREGSFPRFHAELVRAAEGSGTVDRAFRALAAEEAASERTMGKVVARLAYPVVVLHFAAVPLNIALLVKGKTAAFFLGVVAWWIPLWAAGFLGWWLLRRARTGGAAASLMLGIPILGRLLRNRALLRWARVYAALDDAGVAPDVAAVRAAAVTGFRSLEEPLARPAALIRGGASREEAFAAAPLPVPFQAALARGEKTGTVAESLGKEADAMEHALQMRSDSIVALLPVAATILVGIVVLWVAIQVISTAYAIR